ncbi:hypothetical protein B1H10_06095 [candidate division KSB1 bacterium 4484_188]|nr:MAG: hypothetical protein B1H10_06095 [candidate division KSB1 bacterium 4484_188]
MKTILSQDAANFPGGCYQIILNLAQPVSLAVARLGLLRFPPGFYIYTGSQQRSLLKRVERHLRPEKKIHWHIDYLTVHPPVVSENERCTRTAPRFWQQRLPEQMHQSSVVFKNSGGRAAREVVGTISVGKIDQN